MTIAATAIIFRNMPADSSGYYSLVVQLLLANRAKTVTCKWIFKVLQSQTHNTFAVDMFRKKNSCTHVLMEF